MKKSNPFRELEVQLRLQKLEKDWEKAKKNHSSSSSVESADEILKLSVEKIKLLSEMYLSVYEA